MSEDYIDQVKKAIIGPPRRIVKQFNVADYKDNPALIEKLYEEKLIAVAEALDLKRKCDDALSKVAALDQEKNTHQQEKQVLSVRLDEMARQSTNALYVSLAAAVLLSLGANLATGGSQEVGGLLVLVACALEVIAFRMTRKPS